MSMQVMPVCACVSTFACACVQCACGHECTHMRVYVCTHVYPCVCTCTCVCVCMPCVCMGEHMLVSVHVCECTCVHVCNTRVYRYMCM